MSEKNIIVVSFILPEAELATIWRAINTGDTATFFVFGLSFRSESCKACKGEPKPNVCMCLQHAELYVIVHWPEQNISTSLRYPYT